MVIGKSGCYSWWFVTTGTAYAGWACNNINLIAFIGDERSKVTFKRGLWTLIVTRSLSHHIRHQEGGLVDLTRRFLVAVGVRRHVAAIETAAGEIECLNPIPIGWYLWIRAERIYTR